jgi:hypothetical protein
MQFQMAIARSVMRVVEAADLSLSTGGREVMLNQDDIAPAPAERPGLAAA